MVANATVSRNHRAFFAQFGPHAEQSGVLIKPAQDVVFFDTESRQYTVITPANVHLLVRLQEVSTYMAQYYADLTRAREERRALSTTLRGEDAA